jgi:membrane protease YdiL (CAAX protease family)
VPAGGPGRYAPRKTLEPQEDQLLAGRSGFARRHSLALGLLLIFALTWPLELGLAAQSHRLLPFHIPDALGLFAGYGIVLAALISTGLTLGRQGVRDLLRRFLVWKVGVRWYAIALLGAALVDLLAIGINALVSGTSPDFSKVLARQIFGSSAGLAFLVVPFFLVDVLTNGEEIGWRGYVLPRLQARHSALTASLVIGVVWTLWHIPRFLMAGNNDSFVWFALDTIAKAVLFTWLFNSTNGSLLIVTLFHSAINTAAVFLPIASSATGDIRPFAIAVAIEWLAAIAVTVATARGGAGAAPAPPASSKSRTAP